MTNPSTEESRDPVLDQESALVHLHNHSEYSALDGGSQIAKMPEKLKSLGMNAMALTDHGVMQGLPTFYDALTKAGMKPILGMEAYLTADRFDKSRGTPTWHLTLLAATTEGYHNLCKLSSWAFIDGVIMTFGRPRARADWELLEKYSKGVIAFTGCMASPVMGAIFAGDLQRARAATERLIGIFGAENVYGEIQNVGITTGIPGDSEVAHLLGKSPLTEEESARYTEVDAGEVPLSQSEANFVLVEHICKPLGLKYLGTGDTHYLNEGDADPHDAMICIGTGQMKKGQRRFSLLPKKYHMRSEEDMRKALAAWPEAIETTKEVALRCNADIQYGKELLPQYPLPEQFSASGDYLRYLCYAGLDERYPTDSERREQAVERLEMELGVITSMGFNDYFLITWDLYNEANRRGILSGPGRGSAAGSIVAYCLDITKLCPLQYDLLFERFLNPGRRSMPDIDMDFMDSRRKELMEYARDKYNLLSNCETAVSQIVTFQRYKAKNAIKDAARVLAEPDRPGEDLNKKDALKLGDRLSAMVPGDPKVTMHSLWDGEHKRDGEQLRAASKQGGLAGEVVTQAGWLEGMIKTYGLHAAAVIISNHDMSDDLPLQRFGPEKPLHTQYDMNFCERLGLLKMDFLGLSNLDIILDACAKIEAVHGRKIDPWQNIPLDDAKTYEMFARGETVGTFQFECVAGDTIIGGGPRKTIAEMYHNPPQRTTSLDLGDGKLRRNDVLQVVASGEKQLYRIVGEGGYTLRATSEHKILTADGWRTVGELQPGERITVNLADASRIGACLSCNQQTKSRRGACTSCANRARGSGQTMSHNRNHETWLASLARGERSFFFGHAPPQATMSFSDLDHPVRSKWEADFARALNALDIAYEYEAHTFALADGKGYTPDFYLTEEKLWVEVKGKSRLCGKGKLKVEQFRRDYPDERLEVISAHQIADFELDNPQLAAWSCPILPESYGFVSVLGVHKDGIEPTYDIAMRAPFNNYIANGIVVHNSSGMRASLQEVRPTEFNDLIALVALYRPGAMAHIPNYARRKHGKEPVEYLDERLEELQGDTYGITIYQEQSMLIARALAGFDQAGADDLRKAIGKKLRDKMDQIEPLYMKGCQTNGVDREVAKALWADNVAAADYSFNKCASGETRVILPDGKRIRLSEAYRLKPREIMSMWSDGEIRPHTVQRIVQTGRKPVVRVRCESGRQIKATLDHRLLTTEGYQRIEEMAVGTELITMPIISEKQREARRKTMTALARRPERKEQDQRTAERMHSYQAKRPYTEKVAHMKRMHELYPDLSRPAQAAMVERVKWLHKNDPEWRQRFMERSLASVRAAYDTGPGYGHCSIASNGMRCASRPEREMCEWLLAEGVEFEMHKVLPNGRICDFYFDGRYWEMDGMDRTTAFFEKKYGDLPFAVVTPEDFKLVIEDHWQVTHAENGDPIVSIETEGAEMTYDVEMTADGPLNFIANGIVSHNSHAACYALISYVTGWLKQNYPHEYMAALLTAAMGDKDKPRLFLTEAKRMGLDVLPPDLNRSLVDFAVIENEDVPDKFDILFGLSAIRGVGAGVVAEIRAERETHGSFTSIYDIVRRMPQLNKTVLQSLVKGGALDYSGASRKSMFECIEESQKRIKKERDAEEKAFINAVRERVEAAVSVAASAPKVEQQALTLDGMEDAFAAAVGSKSSGKKIKMSTNEKRGLEGACKAVWAANLRLNESEVADATEAALKKEALRLARKEAKEQLQEGGENAVGGIAQESAGESSLKERIEELAQTRLAEQALALKREASELCARFLPHLRDELSVREESADIEAAMATETDPTLPSEEWDRIEMLNIERKMLGIYVTGHPLDEDADQWRAYVNEGTERGRELGQVNADDIKQVVLVVGAVVGKQGIKMRSGEVMYRVTLEDLSGSRDVTIFPRTLEGGLDQLLNDGQIVCLEAGVQEDTFQKEKDAEAAEAEEANDEGERPIKLIASRLFKWDASRITDEFVAKAKARRAQREAEEQEAATAEENAGAGENGAGENGAGKPVAAPATSAATNSSDADEAGTTEPKAVTVAVSSAQFNPEWVNGLRELCANYPGPHPVKLVLDGTTYNTKFSVAVSPELAQAIKQMLHPEQTASSA